ncbi:Hypothetical protein NTJ_09831 [Nesidiocoris tenuis]|uniref:Uncharacterized protein n=1 Tax=Nesidiocoris tenuis TaxID=355587 RepID=A0ABN7AXX2_9HEMI|nr:Hypothetical protein NTJ_09831 [Nesidiocoris tenuis]
MGAAPTPAAARTRGTEVPRGAAPAPMSPSKQYAVCTALTASATSYGCKCSPNQQRGKSPAAEKRVFPTTSFIVVGWRLLKRKAVALAHARQFNANKQEVSK